MTRSRFTIYCHTNKVNGKRYIGQTSWTMEDRWAEHVRAAKKNKGCRIFGAAIKEHGENSFDHEVLEIVLGTSEDSDKSEIKWIGALNSRAPNGYNLTVGGSGLDKVRACQKEFWSQLSPEEKSQRVRHQISGMSREEKSARVRKAWASMAQEDRDVRIRKAADQSVISKSTPEHIKLMSDFQTAQAKLRTPEQRRAMVLKSWEVRRSKYENGVGRMKTSESYSEGTRKGWETMTPAAREERVRKSVEGRRKAKALRLNRLVRINLLLPESASP